MEDFSIEKFDTLLKAVGGPSISVLYSSLAKKSNSKTKVETVENLLDYTILLANSNFLRFSWSQMGKIKELFNNYIKMVKDYRLTQDALAGYKKTYRLKLIQDLLANSEPLRRVMAGSIGDFIKLVFDTKEESLKNVFLYRIDRQPFHSSLFEIIYNSYGWSTQTFKDLGIELSYNEIKAMRTEIKDTVFNWITSSKYQKSLYDGKLLRKTKPVAPELNLVFSLWVAARRKVGKPNFNFIKTLNLGDRDVIFNLRHGEKFITPSLIRLRDTIRSWHLQEHKEPNTDLRKTLSYKIAISQIGYYARIRGRDLLRKGPVDPDRKNFNTVQAKVYNVILGLSRHLGMDPAFFRPVEDQMFDMNKGVKQMFKDLGKKLWTYVRHHFRNNPDRGSIAIYDQVIIDTRSHSYWESMMSEDDTLVATQVLENLIKYNREVLESDIENEFMLYGPEYSWIAANWIDDRKFADNLKTFNDRKDDIKVLPILEFIEEHYPIAYNKFITTLLKDKQGLVRDIIQAMHPTIDISALVNIGSGADYVGPYSTVFTEIMKMYNYPVYF